MTQVSASRKKGLFQATYERLFGVTPSVFDGADSQRTDRVILWLFRLGLTFLGVVVIYGLTLPNGAATMHFIGWAVAAAFMASMVGMSLGLLFGLPSPQSAAVRRAETAAAGSVVSSAPETTAVGVAGDRPAPKTAASLPSPAPMPDVPYNDSTSLEQIADWLTKIIVGLTLTQYPQWESRFQALSQNLTATLFDTASAVRTCVAQAGAMQTATIPQQATRAAAATACANRYDGMVPGGLILISYLLLGFSMSYLWMRRYFIIEMVTARIGAQLAMVARNQTDVARADQEKALAEAASAEARTKVAEERSAKAEAEAKTAAADAARALAELAAQRALFEEVQKGAITEDSRTRDVVDLKKLGATIAKAGAAVPIGSGAQKTLAAIGQALASLPPKYPDDPWRENFGGLAEAGGFRLDGAVSATVDLNTFQVEISVTAITDAAKSVVALQQSVWIFLHPTFEASPFKVAFDAEGKAYIKVYAYGGFTVGAVTEDGTMLELDLAALPDPNVPSLFRQR